jgi:6-phosphogluconolactonase
MRMKLNRSSQRSQNQSGLIAEAQKSSRSDQQGAATSKAAKSGLIHSGFALLLVAAASLIVASLLTACETLTVDFVFVLSTKAAGTNQYGEINVFEINSESGRMRQIPTSPFPSAGRDPVAEVVSADYQNLFVANQDDNTIVQFVIGSDGKLYPFNTVNTPGIYPLAVTANKSNLFVVDTYEPLPLCSTAHPCPGSVSVYPLSASTSSCTATTCMGSPAVNPAVSGSYWPLTLSGTSANDIIVPTGVNVLASGAYVYVTAYDSSVSPSVGYVFGFSVGSGGVLTPLSGSPFAAGIQPSAIASDPTSAYVYVTDFVRGNVLAYTVSSGNLTPMSGSPFPAGNEPSAIVVDPSFSFAYVANSGDATVQAYSISNGTLSSLGNSGSPTTYATGLQPVAMGIDPSTNHFLYTVNFLDNTISGFELSNTAGTLLNTQSSPYATSAQPVAVAAIPHNGTGGGIQQ